MNYYLIGSGKMASFLARCLHAAHAPVKGIFARNKEKSAIIAAQTGVPLMDRLTDIPDEPGTMCLICVPDAAIETVAGETGLKKHMIMVHTSGNTDIAVLGMHAAHYGCLWPIASISAHIKPLTEPVPVCIDASDSDTLEALRATAEKCFSPVVVADTGQRQILHLSAVLTQNFANHLFAVAEDLCTANGLSANLLKPMLHEWLRTLDQTPAREIQTGPALRGDTNTLQKHRDLLTEMPELLRIYDSLTDSIRKMYG
ncbi:Rossmann-like and DUF2520 domain-containing protein [Rurimicrobium arvi]|uniref:DUF2520 domain-containing protein n=1 Tax=Rurimicrobium arvi TaxID=2049916 RepID=A0ABP8N407_9BACT